MNAPTPAITAPNEVADTLDRARALIEKGWTQGVMARGKSGRAVSVRGNSAVCFCASGAIDRVATWDGYSVVAVALRAAIGGLNIPCWNDAPERTQAEVVQAFKEAAALARAGAL